MGKVRTLWMFEFVKGRAVKTEPLSLFDDKVEVKFSQPPTYEKSPPCPDSFSWNGREYPIVELIEEWHEFGRKGRFAKNMKPEHAVRASNAGSWGVGRFFFRVMTAENRIFDLYFDRAPESAGDRKGHWFLMGERKVV